MRKNNDFKLWLAKIGKGLLVASLATQILASQPLHIALADDDDYEYVYDYDDDWDDDDDDDWDDDDWDDDDWDDDQSYHPSGQNFYQDDDDNDDWDDDYDDDWDDDDWDDDDDDWDDDDWDNDDQRYRNPERKRLRDDDDDDQYLLFNGVWLAVDDDLEDIWEAYYEGVDEYDDDEQERRARPNRKGGKVNADYLDIELKKHPNFMNEEVTEDDDPKQGLVPGQRLENGDEIESITIKEEIPIPSLAQAKKETQYENAKNQEKINTVTVKDPNQTTRTHAIKVNEKTKKDVNENKFLDETLLNQEFLNLLNADRQAAGLKPVEYGTHLQEGANTRTNDLATIGHIRVNNQPHVRLDGSSFREDFNYLGEANKNALGENTAISTYNGNPNQLVSEKALAEQFYKQWKSSPSHYENMMSPDYNFSAISVKMSDKNQLAGEGYNSLIGVQVLDSSVR